MPGDALHRRAVVLALGASEVVLRKIHCARPNGWSPTRSRGGGPIRGSAGHSPRREKDTSRIGGRTIAYAFDRHGYRVRRVDEPVDLARPALVFAGESVMFGED